MSVMLVGTNHFKISLFTFGHKSGFPRIETRSSWATLEPVRRISPPASTQGSWSLIVSACKCWPETAGSSHLLCRLCVAMLSWWIDRKTVAQFRLSMTEGRWWGVPSVSGTPASRSQREQDGMRSLSEGSTGSASAVHLPRETHWAAELPYHRDCQ